MRRSATSIVWCGLSPSSSRWLVPRPSSTHGLTRGVFAELAASWHGPLTSVGRPLTITEARHSPLVSGNSARLRHALDVLLDNALRPGAGEVRIDHTVTTDAVTITVTDEGPGFSGAPLSPREPGGVSAEGALHGLGLPLARRLVETMPGRLTITRVAPHPQIDIVLQRADAPRH